MQDQLIKPSLYVLPLLLCTWNSAYPIIYTLTNEEDKKGRWGILFFFFFFSIHIYLHMLWGCAPLYREAWNPDICLLGFSLAFLTNDHTVSAWLPKNGGKPTASWAAPPLLANSSCWAILFHHAKSASRLIPVLPWSNGEQICFFFLYDSFSDILNQCSHPWRVFASLG